MVPVRGYDKGCSAENIQFVGIAEASLSDSITVVVNWDRQQ